MRSDRGALRDSDGAGVYVGFLAGVIRARPGEADGIHYHFIDEKRFAALKAGGEFLEHAHVHGNWYATSATWLREQIAAGHDVLLEIDWQGAAQVHRLIPDAVLIFILPPTLGSLR